MSHSIAIEHNSHTMTDVMHQNLPAPHEQVVPHDSVSNAGGPASSSADRTPEEVEADNALAERLSAIIEDANERLIPLCNMIRKVHPMLICIRRF